MAAIDKFKDLNKTYEMPSNRLFEITPDDVLELTYVPRCIYVGSSGDMAVTDEFGNVVTFTNLFQGTWLPIRVIKVMATNTSAANLIGMV